jgi:hypothetical protein
VVPDQRSKVSPVSAGGTSRACLGHQFQFSPQSTRLLRGITLVPLVGIAVLASA